MRIRLPLLAAIFLSTICAPIFAQDSNVKLSESNLDEARRILHQAMEAAKSVQNPYDQSEVLARIAGLEVVVGDSQSARRSIGAIHDQSARDYETCRLAYSLANWGRFNLGVSTAQLIQDDQNRNECLIRLGEIQAKAGDTALGVNSASKIDDPGLRSNYLAEIADSAECSHHAEEAAKTFQLALESIEAIRNPEERLSVLLEVANRRAFCDPVGALAMLPQLQNEIQQIKNEDAQERLFGSILNVKLIAGQFDEAIEIALSGNDKQRDSYLTVVIEFQLEAGKFKDATHTLSLIHSPANRDQALMDIALAQAKKGDIASSMNTTEKISSEGERDFPYMDIALAKAKSGQFEQAVAVARKISTDYFEVHTLARIAGLVPVDDANGTAERIFKEASSIKLTIEDSSMELFQISAEEAAHGDLGAAFEAMEGMQEDPMEDGAAKYKASVKENLAYWQCRTGKTNDALVWLARERSAYSRAFISIGIIEALLDRNPPNTNGTIEWDLLREKMQSAKQL